MTKLLLLIASLAISSSALAGSPSEGTEIKLGRPTTSRCNETAVAKPAPNAMSIGACAEKSADRTHKPTVAPQDAAHVKSHSNQTNN